MKVNYERFEVKNVNDKLVLALN